MKRVLSLMLNSVKSKEEREYFRYILAEVISGLVYKKYLFSEYGRIWLDDDNFIRKYNKTKENNHSADRKYFMINLINICIHLEGDLVECGVYKGDSAELICDELKGEKKALFLFDSFQGLPIPDKRDGSYWKYGDFSHTSIDYVKNRLSPYNAIIYQGWIPERFCEVENNIFCFVHIDVDLYQPTYDSISFFYERVVPGGVILFDDYGFRSCVGAREAVNDFLLKKPERICCAPTGQAFIVKR